VTSTERKDKLGQLVKEYLDFKAAGKLDLTSEETIRTWLNNLLQIFGWDVRDTSQVLQEKVLSKIEKERLKEIDSTNSRPDYTFKVAKQKLTFLDAKALWVDLKTDSNSAFQIKSYGWSILAPCAFISNFEQFVIYDCTYMPSKDQKANFGRIFLSIEDYLDNFEILEQHLLKENIYEGKLNELYNDASLKGVHNVSPDFAFADLLSNFRIELANNIYQNNKQIIEDNSDLLSYLVQIIVNRILFIRVCEARKIEEDGLLLSYQQAGFWTKFKESSYFTFYEHYDGPLFERIESIHQLTISDEVFSNLLQNLYYPSPYRFDVIPTKLLSDIYEIFLSKKLKIEDDIVKDELKSEYSKTKGAVSTPQYIVEDVIRRTLKKDVLLSTSIAEFLDIKILDIACGSGVFAIEVYDYLEELLKTLYENNPDENFDHLFFRTEHELILNLAGKKAILDNCVFGVDIDPEAVEVAKMALALKTIDNADYPQISEQIGLFGNKILEGIGKNIRCGNTLVDNQILTQYPSILEDKNENELIETNPFDWDSAEGFEEIFTKKGGFDYIIGNPPYVEVKNYNAELPHMHAFIKANYPSSKNGKIDLAIPFIERGILLLNDTGRLGFIVQKRFFKTDYGKQIRETISSENLVSSVIDFETTKIFKGRTTYVSTLVLDKATPKEFYYKLFKESENTLAFKLRQSIIPEIDSAGYHTLPAASLSKGPWSFDNPELLAIKLKLLDFGTFGDIANVKVGIQSLKNEAYHIRALAVEDGFIKGSSSWDADVKIEEESCRPLFCNEHFYMFRPDTSSTFVIFPYEVINGKMEQIPFTEYCEKFPLAGQYLRKHRNRLEGSPKNGGVQTLPVLNPDKYSSEFWHIFTRANNIGHTYPKVLIPMTAMDTLATVTFSPKLYCDNANMFFVQLENPEETNLYCITGIVNSTVFSVLARSIANPQMNGYFKFNKQFLEPIPFPVANFNTNDSLKSEIAAFAQTIEQKQAKYLLSSPTQKSVRRKVLQTLWDKLDQKVYEMYELSAEEIDFFQQKGRNLDRIEILGE
jgi:SAM-dependent methyltransferase